jgi:hypothetical protein
MVTYLALAPSQCATNSFAADNEAWEVIMTQPALNSCLVRAVFLGGFSIATVSCGRGNAIDSASELEEAPFRVLAESQTVLPSDRTVAEFYRLTSSPDVREVMALFHASFCEPCKVVETPEYQRAIREFNESQSGSRVVTIRVDNENDPLVDSFWEIVGPVPIQVTHIKTGEEEIVEDSIIPSALLLFVPSGKYARSMKIPPNPEAVESWARKGFRYPERFEKSFPQIKELGPK